MSGPTASVTVVSPCPPGDVRSSAQGSPTVSTRWTVVDLRSPGVRSSCSARESSELSEEEPSS